MTARPRLASALLLGSLALSFAIATGAPTRGESGACALIPDDRNPSERMLRCGDDLTIRAAPGTRYTLVDQQGQQPPKAAKLESGALLVEFKPSEKRRTFQILTPNAVAAVRGTKWAVEVDLEKSATLVVLGYVEVKRPDGTEGVLLRAGQGVDVTVGSAGPLLAKRWPKPRADALLARFGQ